MQAIIPSALGSRTFLGLSMALFFSTVPSLKVPTGTDFRTVPSFQSSHAAPVGPESELQSRGQGSDVEQRCPVEKRAWIEVCSLRIMITLESLTKGQDTSSVNQPYSRHQNHFIIRQTIWYGATIQMNQRQLMNDKSCHTVISQYPSHAPGLHLNHATQPHHPPRPLPPLPLPPPPPPPRPPPLPPPLPPRPPLHPPPPPPPRPPPL